MFRARWLMGALMIAFVLAPSAARARGLGVDVWTDRGKDAVYEPGEPVEIKVRAADDAYLIVYDIDSEGYVRVLYPYQGSSGYVAGRHTYRVPPYQSGLQLVVEGPVGQGYIVAVASREPFKALPWYLRPYDPQADESGYVGGDEDEDNDVTSDGRIMGDPFVAMERIRRTIVEDAQDEDGMGTAYTSYYVHQAVRYPRYLCNDCHRPRYWAWWDGWDPYYTSCSAFDFRVYWGWSWGPSYWFGTVPYFCYVPRCYPCAPYDRPYYHGWNGWRTWNTLWGGHMTRYKSPAPAGYVAPNRWDWTRWKENKPAPPGFLTGNVVRTKDGVKFLPPVGRNRPVRPNPAAPSVGPDGRARTGLTRQPLGRPRDEGGMRYIRPDRGQNRSPLGPSRTPDDSRFQRPRNDQPGYQRPRTEPPGVQRPGYDRPRTDRPGYDRPRTDRPSYDRPRTDRPGYDRPRYTPSPGYSSPRNEGRPSRAPEARPSSPPRSSPPPSRPSSPPPSRGDGGHRDSGGSRRPG